MQLIVNDIEPIETYPYLEVGSQSMGSSNSPEIFHKRLPIYIGEWHKEKTDVDLIIICSDLQGIVEKNGEKKLLGEELPEFLKLLIDIEFDSIKEKKIGVFLCGDLFTSLKKRGSSGDVRNVWKQFKEHFSWVVGVAGNHDRFGNPTEIEEFKKLKDIYLLHKTSVNVSGIEIGGISGIIGRNDKTNRVEEVDYIKNLQKLLRKKLDFILLHETPDYPLLNQIGNSKIRATLEKGSKSKICCGHCFWEKSLVELENKTQVLNSDSKVIILKIKNKNNR